MSHAQHKTRHATCCLTCVHCSISQEALTRNGSLGQVPFGRTGAFILVDGMKGTTAVLLPQGSGDIGFSAAFRRLPVLVHEALAEHGINDVGILEIFSATVARPPGDGKRGDEKCSYCQFFHGAWCDSTYGYCSIRYHSLAAWLFLSIFPFFVSLSSSAFLFPLLLCSRCFGQDQVQYLFLFQQDGVSRRKWKTGRVELRGFRGLRRLRISKGFPTFCRFREFFKNSKKSSSSAKASSEDSSELSSYQMAIREKFGGFLQLSSHQMAVCRKP